MAQTDNVVALAFGVFIVVLFVAGSALDHEPSERRHAVAVRGDADSAPTNRRARASSASPGGLLEALMPRYWSIPRSNYLGSFPRGVIHAVFHGQPIQRPAGGRK
jgi:hypothetical protein